MAVAVQEDAQSKLTELAREAMEAFCDDISTMFEADISCSPKQQGPATMGELKKLFKKVIAVHAVKAQGTLDGMFHIVFDQGGLFTLGGIVVMLPEARIREEAKRGTEKDAKVMSDAVGEVGNLLVGAWDRIFRESCEGHIHFVKGSTFIGVPWEKPQDSIGLAEGEDLDLSLYEVTVAPYPPFSCAVLFPKDLLTAKPKPPEVEEEPAEASSKDSSDEADPSKPGKPEAEDNAKPTAQEQPQPKKTKAKHKEKPGAKAEVEPTAKAEVDVEPAAQAEVEPTTKPDVEPAAQEQPQPSSSQAPAVQPAVVAPSDTAGPAVAQAAIPRGPGTTGLLDLSVRQVMSTEVVWVSPDESVLDVLQRMQHRDVGYAMVGRNGALEGIVSRSNILGGISPYLRPAFAKWRRPEDDATLTIKIKWLMSRPVQTLSVQATLGHAIERMQQFGGRCLPVVDPAGKILGIVTVFDILKVLNPNKSLGKTPQAPCLMT